MLMNYAIHKKLQASHKVQLRTREKPIFFKVVKMWSNGISASREDP